MSDVAQSEKKPMPPFEDQTLEQAMTVVLTAVRKGLHEEQCAQFAGITTRTLKAWINRGAKEVQEDADGVQHATTIHGHFYLHWNRECARCVSRRIDMIEDAGKGRQVLDEEYNANGSVRRRRFAPPQWQANMTLVERRHDAWKPGTEKDISGGAQINIMIAQAGAPKIQLADSPGLVAIEGDDVVDSDFCEADGQEVPPGEPG